MGWMPHGRSVCTCHFCPCHLSPDSSVMHNFSSLDYSNKNKPMKKQEMGLLLWQVNSVWRWWRFGVKEERKQRNGVNLQRKLWACEHEIFFFFFFFFEVTLFLVSVFSLSLSLYLYIYIYIYIWNLWNSHDF